MERVELMMLEYLQKHPYEVRYGAQFPVFADRAAWEQVAPADRDDLLALAETWRGQPYPLLTAGMYASYVRTGSRKDCETPYFQRRVKLIAAAMHVCLTGEMTDLPQVEDGLWLLCEETTWAISAHLSLTAEHPFPDDRQPVIDLFAAQTAMILSFVCQLLQDELHPDVYDRVRREVERRVLSRFMTSNEEWWMGYVRKDLCNWTPWILSNILMAANVWHFGGAPLVERVCMMLDRWLAVVPEDGGCDEGAGYWNMAAGAFLDCLMSLETMAGVDLWQNGKVRRMMAYPELVCLGSGWFANFADCDARPCISGERLQYAGLRTENNALVRMGVEMWGTPSREIGDVPHLSRLLMRLFARPATAEAAGAAPKDVYLPDLQVRLLEMGSMTAAMKGGHNAESHNHNDVGSFLVMAHGDMQVVDAGNMVYTAKTFSDRRYELWNCRAAFHNVPMIDGCEQQPGREYAAKDMACFPDGMTVDMADAYPGEAGMQKCCRTFRMESGWLSVRDEIALDAAKPVTWVFMLRHEPELVPGQPWCRLAGQAFCIRWNGALSAAAESIDVTDARMAKSYPGRLWRLTLTAAPDTHHTQEFLFEA